MEIDIPLWNKTAEYAYAGFATAGRGIVAMEVAGLLAGKPAPKYVKVSDLATADFPSADAEVLAERYDPENQFVLLMVNDSGKNRAEIITPPSGAATPRQLYEEFRRRLGF